MDAETVNQLLEINRAFYAQFSADFSDSRSSERFNLEPFRKYLANDIRLLDGGCGNGRLAGALERAGFALDYMGIEQSPELLAVADRNRARLKKVRAQFRQTDLTARGWSESLQEVAPFDVIVCLAVLHHIPSFDLRVQVLGEIRGLLKPQGTFIMSNWQFLNNERLRKKIVPWDLGRDVPVERLPLERLLEHGDYLLDWKRGGMGYRYVHLIDETEVNALASTGGFGIIKQFQTDNNLNLYSILQPQNKNLVSPVSSL